MQSTDLKEIKAALWEQAFLGGTRVSCAMGQVMAIRRRKGQLLALIRGWGRWYPVEGVIIENAVQFAQPAHFTRRLAGTLGEVSERGPVPIALAAQKQACQGLRSNYRRETMRLDRSVKDANG